MTELTQGQHGRLDRIALEDPEARVVGLGFRGPVVEFGDGRLREVSTHGRLLTGGVSISQTHERRTGLSA